MAGYGTDGVPAGGEAGSSLGAQAPPDDGRIVGHRLNGEQLTGNGAHAANSEYSSEFVTEYVNDHGGAGHRKSDYSGPGDGLEEGFGWLLGPIGSDDPAAAPTPLPIDEFGDEAAMVRPYAWTGGRTKANYGLKLETLISTTGLADDETLLPQLEHRAVSTLCRYPLSVAEIAAKLSIPLGVARVILSDMAELGLISIHRTFADDDIAAHLVLMERVLSGLRRL
jgi:hypothetical protein